MCGIYFFPFTKRHLPVTASLLPKIQRRFFSVSAGPAASFKGRGGYSHSRWARTHTLCLARQFTIGQLLRQHWPRPAKLTTCLILDCRRCSSPIYEANPHLLCLRNKFLGPGAPSCTPKLFLTPQLCLCRDGLTAPPTPSSAPWSPPSLPSKSSFPAFLTLGQCPAS